MKKVIIVVLVFIGFTINAQQQELIENTWYLEKIGGEDGIFFPPNSDEFDAITLNFTSENQTMYFQTGVCANIEGVINSINDNQIEYSELICCGNDSCTIPDNIDFENRYEGFFQFEELLFYSITENSDGTLNLFLGSSTFGELYFKNYQLSTSDITEVKENHIKITFQNDNLIIQSSSINAESVSIYELSGKLVLTSDVQNNKINTSGISKGIYLIKIKDEKGITHSKKLRKQ